MHRRRHRLLGKDAAAGWLFTLPVIVILGLFLVVPVLMALWVSLSDWTGRGSPFSSQVGFVGLRNYSAILSEPGLAQRDFGLALRNNLYYVLAVVPLQTVVALLLAVAVNQRALRGKGFFRTAFYFPSVTSAVAITVLWLFLFNDNGVVNKAISFIGLNGPNWFQDPRGVVHVLLSWFGVDSPPAALTQRGPLGVTPWEWLAGPSVAMSALVLMAVFTTSGTFMLLFLAALQALDPEVEEAAMMDGAGAVQRFLRVTLPQLRPTLFTVLTLGLIGTWQVFDQIYTGTQGGPSKTTLTPAYLSYTSAFESQRWGQGAAISFILFAIIVIFTVLQRLALVERDPASRSRRRRAAAATHAAPAEGSVR
ncbi:sugar ABC transporter permease [Brachybacterium sp. EF45031]|uniref:carbohydrate ABC transporter permease n=1 Tax=Brachybacterium sillae TaxID=2810536 RepID=UPI00217E37B6|nr:sugar ABC transporter permease [Brachybacterium sillae]MCS6711524.1 sugar ABC transporter permease [Brachybacterium sillae]